MDIAELLGFKPDLSLPHNVEVPSKPGARSSTDTTGNAKKKSRIEVSRNISYSSAQPGQTTPYRGQPSTPVYSERKNTPYRPRQETTPYRSKEKQLTPYRGQQPTPKRSSSKSSSLAVKMAQAPAIIEESSTAVGNKISKDAQFVLEKLEEMENMQEEGEELDEQGVKKMIMNFEKKVMKNQELRIKFPDDPMKFMESELKLNEGVQELHVMATVPDLYPILVETGAVKTLLSLLSHENTDISIAVVDLLQEMTDVEDVEDSEGTDELLKSLMDGQIIATLMHNLQRLDETVKHEEEGVHNTLGIIENLSELQPIICNEAGPGGLLAWLLRRLKAKIPFNGNKLYASEILAICVQNHTENQKLLGTIEGIDILLQQLAQYKRHNPSSQEEQEMMENLFDALCSCLLHTPNRELFLQGEGLQLMNLMLREKKVSRNGALRVLSHALAGREGTDNCNKFIDILGLRTIFPLFMKTPGKHGKKGLTREQHEEHVISIISFLLRNCKPSQKQRLISKFTENDHEKVDRLLELHFKYLEKVLANNTVLEEQAKAEGLDEDELYLRRLDGGLFTLQLVDLIMLDVCAKGPPSIKRRVIKILNVRNASIKTIKNIIREFASNIGDGDTTSNQDHQEAILELLDKFQNT